MNQVFNIVNERYYFDNKHILKFKEESTTRAKGKNSLNQGLDRMLENIRLATE